LLIRELIARDEMPSPSSHDFPVVATLLSLFATAFFTLSLISFFAARDLWKLRERGRKLAFIAMLLWLSVCAILVLVAWRPLDLRLLRVAAGLGMFAIFFLVYLQLHTTRSKFAN
jgi:hypothetical protein